jgi:hypothetical protein
LRPTPLSGALPRNAPLGRATALKEGSRKLEPTEQYRTQKLSLNRKRLYASYNLEFLLKILLNF